MALVIEPTLVQVTACSESTNHASPPFGSVSVNEPTMSNTASEVSNTLPSCSLTIFTLTAPLIVSGMVQGRVPSDAVTADSITLGYVPPPSVEYRISTVEIVPVFVQVMFSELFTTHASLPFGAVTTSDPLISNTPSDSS